MERINAKDVQSMMEAYASIYNNQEQLDEQSRPTGQQRAALRTARRQAAADLKATEIAAGGGQAGIDNALKQRYGGRMPSERQQARHSSRNLATRSVAATGRENLYRGGGGDAAVKKGQTKDQVIAQGVKNFKAKQAAPVQPVQSTKQVQSTKPVQSTNTLNKDQQAVNREYDRLRAKDPEAAAVYGKKMAARGAARSDFKIEKPTQAQSNPTAVQKQARVDAAIKSVNTPEKMNKPAPAGSALRAQQDAKAAAAGGASKKEAEYQAVKAGVGVSKGTVKDPKIAADAARKAELEAIRAKAKADTMKKSRLGEDVELDVFDTIKEYLIGEGATEEEALKQMTILTDEQRTEILEGIIGQTADTKN